MAGWEAWLGRTATAEDIVAPTLVTRWRATLDSALAADVVPQGLHWCLCPPDTPTAMLGEDGHPRRDDDKAGLLPPVPLPRRMWAASDVRFHAPLAAAMTVARQSTVAAITPKSGRTGEMLFVDIDHRWTAGATLLIEERQTLVYREAAAGAQAPMTPGPGSPALDGWAWHRALVPSEALLLRYSALTFNAHRIHYDRPYAVGVEGYRGIVVHGPLTASLLIELVQRECGVNALARFTFRGESPAFAGETLHLVGQREGAALTLAALGSDGRTVMRAEAALSEP